MGFIFFRTGYCSANMIQLEKGKRSPPEVAAAETVMHYKLIFIALFFVGPQVIVACLPFAAFHVQYALWMVWTGSAIVLISLFAHRFNKDHSIVLGLVEKLLHHAEKGGKMHGKGNSSDPAAETQLESLRLLKRRWSLVKQIMILNLLPGALMQQVVLFVPLVFIFLPYVIYFLNIPGTVGMILVLYVQQSNSK